LLLSQLACMGRHTLTGLLCTAGRQFSDWSADYRLFERDRIDEHKLFSVVQQELEAYLCEGQPLVTAMDDSILRKRGTCIDGVGWRRDPLSPPFHVNFTRGQRVLQISAALPCGPAQARMIPIDFRHVPPAPKPSPKASLEAWQCYRQEARQRQLNQYAIQQLAQLRQRTEVSRPLWVVVDGRFTNRTVLKNLPAHTTLIGRIRKDAKLYDLPQNASQGRGRRRVYGQRLPTPDQLRRNESIPWQELKAYACGKVHTFRIKTLAPVRWRTAGNQDVRLIVIAPLAYRKSKKAKLEYRHPAYLICTDPHVSVDQILQAYIWRWDIEVNFRDEKTLFGVGEAQVRTPVAAQKVPSAAVAAYSLLLLAAAGAFGPQGRPDVLPPPKWRKPKDDQRASTPELVNHLRFELWGHAIHQGNFSSFTSKTNHHQKPQKIPTDVQSAVFYAMG
jgi:hypothetical protein